MKKLVLISLITIFGLCRLDAQTNDFLRAFDSLHVHFSTSYPFGKWKAIDWDKLYATTRPKIEQAAVANDSVAFYIALNEYTFASNDGHVNIRHGWSGIRDRAMRSQIGGCYGFSVIEFDDGRIVSWLITPGSPAELNGMKFGAEILEVNDRPAKDVLNETSVIWAELIPATLEAKKLNQCRFLGRAPIGQTMKIKFLNRQATEPVTVTLTAVDDNYATYTKTSLMPVYEPGHDVTSKIIQPENYGYIKLTSIYGDSITYKKLYRDFRNALIAFKDSNVNGLVLDMRMNYGGLDALSAALCGFFYTDTVLYEYLSYFDPASSSLVLSPDRVGHLNQTTLDFEENPNYPNAAVYVEPQGLTFTKPVAVLVSSRNISSGEGVPMMLKKLPNCRIVSFYGTHASFALVGYEHYLFASPDSLYFRFPFGASLDANLKIQMDSDSLLNGGVVPNVRVPMNDTIIDQLYLDSIDVEVNYAIKTMRTMVGVEDDVKKNDRIILDQNAPNPFSKSTAISYHLQKLGLVNLTIYDLQGKSLYTLVNENQVAGDYSVKLDSVDLRPGTYFYSLKCGTDLVTRKCIIIK
jgi:carboxyl-terminal processing protease